MRIKLKSLNYSLDIVGSRINKPSIFINPGKHNIDKNKKTGHRRFYMNEKGLLKFQEFIMQQWKNNFIDFEDVWKKILKHQGESFYTAIGLELKYEIKNDKLHHNRTKPPISKADFKRVYEKFPIDKPSDIRSLGGSYVYAILNDERISG